MHAPEFTESHSHSILPRLDWYQVTIGALRIRFKKPIFLEFTVSQLVKSLLWNESLIRRYDRSGPRYTSYPTAVEFQEPFELETVERVAAASRESGKPLSLYVHIPFCARLCYYCACNKVVTKRREKSPPYLARLDREAAMQSALFGGERAIEQLHFGGGTPTFFSPDELRQLMTTLRRHFNIYDDGRGDYSIEIDPRELQAQTLSTLREIGFNRISLGVQDFDPKVQKAVNRIQPFELTAGVLEEARTLGFGSINLDLIYGLPFQTLESFSGTLDQVLTLRPDRLSVFNYAHLPSRFMPQRRIQTNTLPSPAEKLAIFEHTIERLLGAGYQYIGMDHFALPDDPLAQAQRAGKLHRNFQGYTTHGHCDLVSLGVSAIGQTEAAYFQNHHDQQAYEQAIDEGKLAIKRGVCLNRDDRIRRDLIMRLICQFQLDIAAFEQQWSIDWADYFETEIGLLKTMAADGLLVADDQRLQVLPPGRLLIRVICQVFDRYRQESTRQGFSRIL